MTNATDLEERLSLMPADLHLSKKRSKKAQYCRSSCSRICFQGCFLHAPAKLWLLLIAKEQCTEYLSFDLVWELHCSLQNKQRYLMEASVMHSYRKI